MAGGRPRYTSPTIENVDFLGEDLVKWATEPTDEKRTSWQFWYALRHGMMLTEFKALKKLAQFRPYYEIARAAMSQKIHSDALEKGMAHRYARMYDRQLAEEEDDHARFEADLKKPTINVTTISQEEILKVINESK